MIKILQWNLENFFIEVQDPLIRPNTLTEEQWSVQGQNSYLHSQKPLFKIEEIVKTIKNQDPDVLVFSEVAGKKTLNNFNSLFLDNKYEVYLKESNSKRGIEVGFLVKKDLGFEIHLKSNLDFNIGSNNNPRYYSRDVPELHLKQKGTHLVVLGVHLKSRLPSPDDYMGIQTRSLESKGLLKITANIKKQSSEAIVLIAGDFNGFLQENNVEMEFEELVKVFKDVFDLSPDPNRDRTTYVRVEPQDLQQIDYILMEPQNSPLIHKAEVVRYLGFYDIPVEHPISRKEKDNNPSDHYPQILILNI